MHTHGERLRRDLEVERAAVAGLDLVEARRAIGDHAREDVQAAGRRLRIRAPAHRGRQRQRFEERHQIDGAALERGAALE